MNQELNQAAQQALEALGYGVAWKEGGHQKARAAIDALGAALTTSQPAQTGDGYLDRLIDALLMPPAAHTESDLRKLQRQAAEMLQLMRIASLPTQPAAQADSMGMPTSCGKPLCSPDEHHPLCRLHKPAAQATPDVPEVCFGNKATPEPSHAAKMLKADVAYVEQQMAAATPEPEWETTPKDGEQWETSPKEATPEPITPQPLGYIPTDAIDQIKTPPRLITHKVPVLSYAAEGYTAIYTHPAPGVPDGGQHEIAAALALFPINITGQSFVVSGFNDGKLLEADGDTFFFSQQKVIALLEKLHTHLAAAQAKGVGA